MYYVWRVLKQKICQGKNPSPRKIGELWDELKNEKVISFIESILGASMSSRRPADE
jgi:hypothetical protein